MACSHNMANGSTFEAILPAEQQAQPLRGSSQETLQSCSGSPTAPGAVACPESGMSSTYLRECHLGNKDENAKRQVKIWSAMATRARAVFQSHTACGTESDSRGNIRMRWNAAIRRASNLDPMRCLQDRMAGCRWASATSSSVQTIWLLGVCYALSAAEGCCSSEIYKTFEADFGSRIWITYRKGFQAFTGSKLTTDAGWGCMIRTGQMLLAEGLICHYLGRNWRRSDSNLRAYMEILQCFGDAPTCLYSIHNIIKNGSPYGLVAGSWLGPYAICRSLEALLVSDQNSYIEGYLQAASLMAIHVVGSNLEGERGGAPCICVDAVSEMFKQRGKITGDACALLLLIPLVLGMNKINRRYLPLLAETFKFPQSLGLLGGKPGASVYIVGIQGEQVVYLDPHHVQQVCLISPDNPRADTSSYHCSNVKKMEISSIDPSVALGFYCRNQEEFMDLCGRASELERKGEGAPMFTVVKSIDSEPLFRDCQLRTQSDDGWQLL